MSLSRSIARLFLALESGTLASKGNHHSILYAHQLGPFTTGMNIVVEGSKSTKRRLDKRRTKRRLGAASVWGGKLRRLLCLQVRQVCLVCLVWIVLFGCCLAFSCCLAFLLSATRPRFWTNVADQSYHFFGLLS